MKIIKVRIIFRAREDLEEGQKIGQIVLILASTPIRLTEVNILVSRMMFHENTRQIRKFASF